MTHNQPRRCDPHESKRGFVRVQLRRWHTSSREDSLLPVTSNRLHRTMEHVIGELCAHDSSRLLIGRICHAAVRPGGALLEKDVGQHVTLDANCTHVGVGDDLEGKRFDGLAPQALWRCQNRSAPRTKHESSKAPMKRQPGSMFLPSRCMIGEMVQSLRWRVSGLEVGRRLDEECAPERREFLRISTIVQSAVVQRCGSRMRCHSSFSNQCTLMS